MLCDLYAWDLLWEWCCLKDPLQSGGMWIALEFPVVFSESNPTTTFHIATPTESLPQDSNAPAGV